MRIPSIVSHDAERDTYLVLDDFGGRLDCAWREIDAESADRATADPRSAGRPMTMARQCPTTPRTRVLRIMGCDTGPGGDLCAHGFRSTESTLLNEEAAFDGDVVEAQLDHDTEKKSADGATSAWQGRQEQDPRHLSQCSLLGRTRAFNAALV